MTQFENIVRFAEPVASHPNPGRQPPPWGVLNGAMIGLSLNPLSFAFLGFKIIRLLAVLPGTTRWKTRRHSVLPSEPIVVVQSGAFPELLAGLGPPPE